ncbi:Ribulose-phosphate 3-epimerase cytoplasmic isoform, partial [Bienertia sinuspersici]
GISGLPSYGHNILWLMWSHLEKLVLLDLRFMLSSPKKELVENIKAKGMWPGVVLKPGTTIEEVYPLVKGHNLVEMALAMTVEPGFGGKK